ncbi:SdiA-regulated domain-containing protein [Pseudomonas sp. PDM16]|uniref:SdiA-regulated domain-containing protein n=1 Tax=Pseudomonas sp. PDM16 TaxID=2769292 RepID=UPI001785D199|nr:SdiA-regulated domain-containing protein [Pseudomonas sp. PDM16]MBD9414871.1 SdiA-regulated domain-containing protein [Pseudomonas sp. PDM16]
MISAAKGALGRLPAISPWIWALLILLFLLYQAHEKRLDERLYYWVATSLQEGHQPLSALAQSAYRVQIEAKPVDGIGNNLSGLTYDDQRDQLWAVLNNPETLLAMSKDGDVLARYPLAGFQDVEGITYLGDDLLLLAEERRQALVIVSLPESPGQLTRQNYPSLTLSLGDGGNQGFEGVGYDREADRLFVVKEHSPRSLYEVRGLKSSLNGGSFALEIIDHSEWIERNVFATDLSSVHYDEKSGHLALLSDESGLLIELSDSGELIGFQSLRAGFGGLRKEIPQAEGVTLDDQGDLYLVSEPNLFYRFERTP